MIDFPKMTLRQNFLTHEIGKCIVTRFDKPVTAPAEAAKPVPKTHICETCSGSGEAMYMVCYGGFPEEIQKDCRDCDGTGQIESIE